jgi:hypothetical protein
MWTFKANSLQRIWLVVTISVDACTIITGYLCSNTNLTVVADFASLVLMLWPFITTWAIVAFIALSFCHLWVLVASWGSREDGIGVVP